jgi:hypothetical protein
MDPAQSARTSTQGFLPVGTRPRAGPFRISLDDVWRGAERRERCRESGEVLGDSEHEEVEVLGRSRPGVETDRVPADDRKLNLCGDALRQQLFEVGV